MTEQINISAAEHKELIITNNELTLHITQQTNSTLRLFLLCLSDNNATINITIEQLGENCTTEIYGLGILHANQQNQCNTKVLHRVGKGISRQTMKYIVTDNAQASFTGYLFIAPNAQLTDAQQNNRNLLLSATAKVTSKPQLEIYADNVKASHGATTGQIDESSVFYMQQRGLTTQQAKHLLIMAFAEDITRHISNEQEQTHINQLIADRLNYINL